MTHSRANPRESGKTDLSLPKPTGPWLAILLIFCLLPRSGWTGDPVSVSPQWLAIQSENQTLKIVSNLFEFDQTFKVTVSPGDNIEWGKITYAPHEIQLHVKKVLEGAEIGPRDIIISKKTFDGRSSPILRTEFWIFSRGKVRVKQMGAFPGKTAKIRVLGKDTQFDPGNTEIIFRNGSGLSAKMAGIEVRGPRELVAEVDISSRTKPAKYSFYIRTWGKSGARGPLREMVFAEHAIKVESDSRVVDQRTVWGEPEKWSAQIGGLGFLSPDYEGSDDSDFTGLPFVDITYKNRLFLNTRQGLGVNVIRAKRFVAGAALGYYPGREEDDNPALSGLGDVDGGVDGRLFAFIPKGPLALSLMFRKDLLDNHQGTLVDLGLLYFNEFAKRLRLNVHAQMTWADEKYMDTYFEIDPGQSARSGLRRFNADAGIKDFNLSSIMVFEITRHWNLLGFIDYTRLLGDAADSPIVADFGSANQWRFGFGTAYRF